MSDKDQNYGGKRRGVGRPRKVITQQVSMRMPVESYERLLRLAAAEERTQVSIIVEAIRLYEKQSIEKATQDETENE